MMTEPLIDISESLWDFTATPIEAISLSSEQIDQAIQLSSQIPNPTRQWQTYLHGLALFGFEQWLEERASELVINRQECSIFQAAVANLVEAVSNLQVNEFRICLIATGSFTDNQVILPRVVVDLPEFVPHFYVLVEVQEEQEFAVVSGFLSYQQLLAQQAEIGLTVNEDWAYQLPLSWFDREVNNLLLYLRCLEPTAIPLPAIPSNRLTNLANMQRELTSLLPQLQSPQSQLWQVLSWEQATAVFTSPELLDWFYQMQVSEGRQDNLASRLQTSLRDLLELLTRRALNVGRWLGSELDDLAQELSWVFLPNLVPDGMRSPFEEFELISVQLAEKGVTIPTQARGAYQELSLTGYRFRLYAITWPLLSSGVREWTLLLILGAAFNTPLPPTLRLRVSDQTGILVEQGLETDNYCFTSVIGSWEEKFLVTVSLAPDLELTLPPFSFQIEG
ncbi:MAG: DUF1822 family protein [Coleofasciculaceae cyanobacterium]